MACKEFEDRLMAWDELAADERERLNAHGARCETCRQLLEAFEELDAAFSTQYAGVLAPAYLRQGVHRRIQTAVPARVSLLPSILDWLAWSAMLAAAALVIHFCLPQDLLSGLSAGRATSQLEQRLHLSLGDGHLPSGHHI
ncbi:MAG: hypothetical protein NTY38_21015 [Acidobacteria bacterium]|nr:hypothetical protein [Acidobacteriota bacterium]